MSERIEITGPNAHGVRVASGYYAINPSGALVTLAPAAPLKTGWRLATSADLERAENAAAEVRDGEDARAHFVGTVSEHEAREANEARAAAKRLAIES